MRPIVYTLLFVSHLLVSLPLAAGQDSPPATEEEKPSKTLKWATASEVDNFGYDVYRSESEEGPFDRLTEDPIQGAGTTDEPSYYQYVDTTIDPQKDYYYYVESISIHGVRERFTPVQKVRATQNPDGSPKDPAEETATEADDEAESSGSREGSSR